MKKMLFVINTMGRGGAETALLELLRSMQKRDVELSLYVLTGQGELIEQLPEGVILKNKNYKNVSVLSDEGKKILLKTSLKNLFKRANCIRLFTYIVKNLFHMIKKKKIMFDKLLWRCFSDAAERFDEEYDMAIAYIEGGSTYYVLDHVKAKKKVAFFHTNYEQAGYTRSLDKDCYLKYDKIFPISEAGKNVFLKYYPECTEKTEVFNNLINVERIRTLALAKGGFTDDFKGYRILTIGRLVPLKEFGKSIEALALLKQKGVDARWYILGDGELRGELEALICEKGLKEDFFLLGVTDNPYPYLKQADIYVHASRFEGKSIAIQEAQVLQCPILVSNCEGNREQVEHGADGLICELTPEDICEGIMQLINDWEKAKSYGVLASHRHTGTDKEIDKILSLM